MTVGMREAMTGAGGSVGQMAAILVVVAMEEVETAAHAA